MRELHAVMRPGGTPVFRYDMTQPVGWRVRAHDPVTGDFLGYRPDQEYEYLTAQRTVNMPTANQPMPAIPADYNYNAATAYMRSATEVAVEEMQDGAALQQQMEDYRRRARALAQERMEAMHPPAGALPIDDFIHHPPISVRWNRDTGQMTEAYAELMRNLRMPATPPDLHDYLMAPTRDTPPSPAPFQPTNNHPQTEQEMARNTRTQHEEPVVVRTVAVKAQTPDIASTVDINEWRNFCSSMSAVKEPAKPSSATGAERGRTLSERLSILRLRASQPTPTANHTVRHDDTEAVTQADAPW